MRCLMKDEQVFILRSFKFEVVYTDSSSMRFFQTSTSLLFCTSYEQEFKNDAID